MKYGFFLGSYLINEVWLTDLLNVFECFIFVFVDIKGDGENGVVCGMLDFY